MQLTYNQFRKVAEKSNEKIFQKISEIFAESENAALMAMYDDKLVLLDEETGQPYVCDYDFSNGVLSFGNFEPIELIENDQSYLEEKVEDLFDIVNDPPVTTEHLLEGFRLKFFDDAKKEISEAIYNKSRMIFENPDIKIKHVLREVRDRNYALFENLKKKPFVKKLKAKLEMEDNAIAQSLNSVDFSNKKGYKVDTNVYQSLQPDISTLDNEIKKKMKALAGKLAKLWKTDAFRNKFEKFVFDLQQSEDMDEAIGTARLFFEDNKELFFLEPTKLDEIILKTALMSSSSKDANIMVEIFNKLLQHPAIMEVKEEYFDSLGASPEEIAHIMFEQEAEDAQDQNAENDKTSDSDKKENAADDLEVEELNDIIAVFKEIRKQLEDESDVAAFVDNIIDDLEEAKAKGISNDRMKEIIDFLQGAKKPEEGEEEEESEE